VVSFSNARRPSRLCHFHRHSPAKARIRLRYPLAIAHSSPIGIQWYRWAAVAQKTLRFGRVGVKKRIEQDRTKVAVAEANIAWIKNSALIFVPIAASVLGIVAVFWWH